MKNFLKFNCLYCGQHMECETRFSGRQIKCPVCEHKMVIPPTRKLQRGLAQFDSAHTWDVMVPRPDLTTPTRYLERAVR